MIFKLTEKEGCKIAEFVEIRRFSLAITESVKSELKPVLADPSARLVLDLTPINFIDSSGMGSIISLEKAAKSSGSKLVLCNLSPEVWSVFKLLHLDMILTIAPDVEGGIKNLHKA